ncbi:hypothetical protein JXA80_10205 [bacterium]|nr:hypothetical protein [candidate division CSSED10-310 bacterium]
MPSTSEGWYSVGENFGFGNYDIQASEDAIYLWSAVFANLVATGGGQPGYTIVMPGNPYDLESTPNSP